MFWRGIIFSYAFISSFIVVLFMSQISHSTLLHTSLSCILDALSHSAPLHFGCSFFVCSSAPRMLPCSQPSCPILVFTILYYLVFTDQLFVAFATSRLKHPHNKDPSACHSNITPQILFFSISANYKIDTILHPNPSYLSLTCGT